MAVSFPFQGYEIVSIFFSTLFILASYVYGWQFYKDLNHAGVQGPVRWLSLASIACLVCSSVEPFTLDYMMASKSTNALLHRDAIYTFLHLQYNGFFTPGIFALLFDRLVKKGIRLSAAMRKFSAFLVASVLRLVS